MYRNDGVDIYQDSVKKNIYYVGSIEDGEWLQYTVTATQQANYSIRLTMSPGHEESKILLSINDKSFAKEIEIPAGNKPAALQDITIGNVPFRKGRNIVRVKFIKGGFSFYSFTISR